MKSSIISSIDKATCLTLDKNIEYAKELVKEAIDYDIRLDLFIAGDGKSDLKYNHTDIPELPPNFPGKSIPLDLYTWHKTPVMYNTFLCHREIVREAYYGGYNTLLMIEDDSVFDEKFEETLNIIEPFFQNHNWDMLFLGSFTNDVCESVFPHVCKMPGDCGGSHGVLIKRKLLKIIKDFLPYESLDGMICHSNFRNAYDCYIVDPSIIHQRHRVVSGTSGGYCDYKRVLPTKFKYIDDKPFYADVLYRQVVDDYQSGIFVELGSSQGKSSICMAEYIKLSKQKIDFYCVDAWLDKNRFHAFVKNLIETKTLNNIHIIREDNIKAAEIFKDKSISFIFINHENIDTKHSFLTWYPKIKPGGIIAGNGPIDNVLPVASKYDDNIWVYKCKN